jgi:hypothetical protein
MKYKRKMKKQERERETKRESAIFTSSRSLLGRGDLRGTFVWPSEQNSERSKGTKPPVAKKGRSEGDGH